MIREPNYDSHGTAPQRVTGAHHDMMVSIARRKTEAQPRDLSRASARLTRASNYHSHFIPFPPEGMARRPLRSPAPIAQVAAVDANSARAL